MKKQILLLLFCAMGFMLLLVIALLERSVSPLLWNAAAIIPEEDIRLTFSALQRVVGVLPYTLGVIILGTFSCSIWQCIYSKWSKFSLAVLIALLIPMIYNIFLADTAAVVENLTNTQASDALPQVQLSLMAAVQQHHIGLLGFTLSFLFQAYIVFTNPNT